MNEERKINSLKKVFRSVEDAILVTLLLAATAIVCYSVVMRYIFNNPPIWNEEITCYLQVWITFLGISVVARQQDNFLRFDFILHKMNDKTRTIVSFVENIVVLILNIVLLIVSTQWELDVFKFGGVSTPLKTPNFIPRMVIPISFLLLSIHYAEYLIESIEQMKKFNGKGRS